MALARGRLILGINCAYHESAAALVRGGKVVFAVEEERFTRIKHAKKARVSNPDELPWNAIRACLEFVPETTLSELDAIAYSLAPGRRLAMVGADPYVLDDDSRIRNVTGRGGIQPAQCSEFRRCWPARRMIESIVDRFHFVSHHRAHAASAFYASPFPTAAILVVDGIGEESTAWLGRGTADGLELIEEIPYPHSIGMLWERVAVYLGFTEFDACKVMGLAAYGDHRRFARSSIVLFPILDRGRRTDREGRAAVPRRRRRSRGCAATTCAGSSRSSVPGEGRRNRPSSLGSPTSPRACNGERRRPCSRLRERLSRATGERDLVFAGGVALNCVSNARLEREGPFRSLFVPGRGPRCGNRDRRGARHCVRKGRDRSERTEPPASRAHAVSRSFVRRRRDRSRDRAVGLSIREGRRPSRHGGVTDRRGADRRLVSGAHGVRPEGAGQPLAAGRPSPRSRSR